MQLTHFMTLLFAIIVTLLALNGQNVNAACGYNNCPAPKQNMINVHLVPHSHDDVGWLKTVDQYYYGARTKIQKAGVQYILDSVVSALLQNSKHRFTYVETAFFKKWYEEQTSDMQKKVKKLVADGQLEFAGGALSMNDEAAVHYQSIIDQFTTGLKELNELFGTCGRPRIGWQIDPFGHSREMASMFAQMGYDGEFFARIDWLDKNYKLNKTSAEMIWKGSADLGESAEIFAGLLYNHYSAPPGFCFDELCNDEPIIDNKGHENNVKSRIDEFIAYIRKLFNYYRSFNLMVPMGDDFNYMNANQNFKNMDKLIKYVNEQQSQGSKINIFYSTPACYLYSVHQEKNTYPNKTQDFFPYSTDWHTYWTGYYSSRPTQKRFERHGNHFLQVVKHLTTITNLTGTSVNNNLNKLRDAMGIMQHHDAITGTEKQHVANDYNYILTDALNAAQINARAALQKLTNLTNGEFESCHQLNISVCNATSKSADKLVVTLYNPLAHPVKHFVRIPVKANTYLVRSQDGKLVEHQLIDIPKQILNLKHRPNDTQYELVFEALVDKISNYYVTTSGRPKSHNLKTETNRISLPPLLKNLKDTHQQKADFTMQNSKVRVTIDATSGHLKSVAMNNVIERISQDFFYYKGAFGNNMVFANRSSGAYIFRPNGTEILIAPKVKYTWVPGKLVQEIHQEFNSWISQVIRIYEGISRVEFEWLIGPIPVNDSIGKEIITRFTTDVESKGVFYTDSNGREMLRRVRNQREDFIANYTEKVSSNYYPLTARMALEDAYTRIALLTDRAQGCTSMKDGQMEIMLHRRLLNDDAFGVGEALNETEYGEGLRARGKYYLMFDSVKKNASANERVAQLQILLPPWVFFSNATKATTQKPAKIPTNFAKLPQNIHLLTLEPYTEKERLLRLESFMDGKETRNVTFNLRDIFDDLAGEEIRETTLDGNMELEKMKRMKFLPEGTKNPTIQYYTSKHKPLSAKKKDSRSKFDVTFTPMQIRTFIVKWK